jgi:hypothetical protein
VHSWVFRNRAQLARVYGVAAEPPRHRAVAPTAAARPGRRHPPLSELRKVLVRPMPRRVDRGFGA